MAATASRSLPITPQQIKLIQIGRRDLGLDEVTYREILRERFGVDSSKLLTMSQATELVNAFMSGGFKPTPKPFPPAKPKPPQAATTPSGAAPKPPVRRAAKPPAITTGEKVVAMVTPAQRAYIEDLRAEIPWRVENGYQRWLEHNMGLTRVATRTEASRVIEGLKGMRKNGRQPPPQTSHQRSAIEPQA